ncbi:P-loop containing nucleoside triphosphate hydrolase [Pseudocohnilembus persalinus]|uniref:p-loop containing nucleoside triphosphate hydrolase n=1 Tax=Pseudocohnilembus persalinus TaxID=266149 RepID=A0A0V0R4C4_PSEPJ|nr:P-loop containing nucleoside triphosphate hydrolase [Pseudocohnilembus persalinus]|eukprot:KRX09329.1 P-loop containing nucleoside triphosphate hydrolase [Pseudocohnilembus persalinus]
MSNDKKEDIPDYQSEHSDSEDQQDDQKQQYIANASSFKDFMLREELNRAIEEAGFEKPSPVQNACINLAVNGRDILCQAQAGTGKTAVFVLSILNQLTKEKPDPLQALVICPTRELAQQIRDEFKRFQKFMKGIWTEAFFGGDATVQDHIQQLKQSPPTIIVGCPGRLLDLVQKKALDLKKIKYFVVDECDQILSNNKFVNQITQIFIETPRDKQVMMFSGTLPKEIRPKCMKFLQNYEEVIVEDTAKLVLNGLDQYQKNLEEKQKLVELRRLLETVDYNQAMIFVSDQERATKLSEYLESKGHENSFIHGRLKQQLRNQTYEQYKQQYRRILIATDLFGRGMDFPRVNLVINFDMPRNKDANQNEQYMHRVGRAGRHFTKGNAISFIASEQDKKQIEEIQNYFSCTIEELPDQIEN